MRAKGALLGAGLAMVAGGAAIALMPSDRLEAHDGSFVRDGRADFVITHFAYALGPKIPETCPNGMSKDVSQIFAASKEGQRRPGEGDEAYSQRLRAGAEAISGTPDGRNYCMHPQLAPRDPHSQRLLSPKARAEGLDLDGVVSRSPADAQSGRLDFVGVDGAAGVDNQFWRVVGCQRSFQPGGLANQFKTEMYTGSWGILVSLAEVDDLRDDDHVRVGIYANADPIQLSPTREALEYVTYAKDRDPRFRAETTGRIKDGVLTTEPVDVRFHSVRNGMYMERPLRDARIQATLGAEGVLEGYLAGYTPVTELYDYQFGFRQGKAADGSPSPLGRRLGSANGAAQALGHTCQGIWQSLHALADGHRDAATGRFTSISTQYKFEARPAFVVDAEASSTNERLASK